MKKKDTTYTNQISIESTTNNYDVTKLHLISYTKFYWMKNKVTTKKIEKNDTKEESEIIKRIKLIWKIFLNL